MLIKCLQCGTDKKACRKTQRFCGQKCDMNYRYANGFKPNVDKAHEVLRTKGHYKRDDTYLREHNPATAPGVGDKISKAKIGVEVKKLQGSNHPNWKGGVTKDLWKSRQYRSWSLAVKRRDNFTCVQCGDNRGGNLESDHIKPKLLFPELIFDIDNGRTLCTDCHKQTNTWGYKVHKLTRQDFV